MTIGLMDLSSFLYNFLIFFVPVPVGLCHAGGRDGAGGRRQAAAGPQPAEGKHSGAAQPATGGGEPEAESGAAAHHFRVNTTTALLASWVWRRQNFDKHVNSVLHSVACCV